jgi:hypothetical protein
MHTTKFALWKGMRPFFQDTKSILGMPVHEVPPEISPGGGNPSASIDWARSPSRQSREADTILLWLTARRVGTVAEKINAHVCTMLS